MKKISRRDFLVDAGLRAASLPTLGLATRMLAANSKNSLFAAKIPATGETLPRLGLGTYSTFDVGSNPDEIQLVKEVLSAFAAAGGKLIDSSPMYGSAEEVTGRIADELGINQKLFMATKVWIRGREAGIRQMAESLAKMRRKKIELMQIHNLVDWRTQLKTLRENKEQGVYKYIGLTHYQTSAFGELEKILRAEKIDFLQIPYSLAETSAEKRLLGAAAERGVAVIANEPFAQGALFRRVRGKKIPAWALEKGITTWAQYFLKFIFANPQVQFAIPATRKVDHLGDNLGGGRGYLPNETERLHMRREFSEMA